MPLKAAEMLPSQTGAFYAFARDQQTSERFPCRSAKAPSASPGKDALAFSLVSLSGPDTDKCLSWHQRYCGPCPQAGFSCPEVPSAWQDALEFVFPVLLRDRAASIPFRYSWRALPAHVLLKTSLRPAGMAGIFLVSSPVDIVRSQCPGIFGLHTHRERNEGFLIFQLGPLWLTPAALLSLGFPLPRDVPTGLSWATRGA